MLNKHTLSVSSQLPSCRISSQDCKCSHICFATLYPTSFSITSASISCIMKRLVCCARRRGTGVTGGLATGGIQPKVRPGWALLARLYCTAYRAWVYLSQHLFSYFFLWIPSERDYTSYFFLIHQILVRYQMGRAASYSGLELNPTLRSRETRAPWSKEHTCTEH